MATQLAHDGAPTPSVAPQQSMAESISRVHNVLALMSKTISPPNTVLDSLISTSTRLLDEPASELPKSELVRVQAIVDVLAQAATAPVCRCQENSCVLQLCKVSSEWGVCVLSCCIGVEFSLLKRIVRV